MLVYRVEHSVDGCGPYMSNTLEGKFRPQYIQRLANSLGTKHNGDSEHCVIWEEVGNQGFSSRHFCGFESMEQLYNWFRGFITSLFECGYVFKTYNVPDQYVLRGRYQLAFEMDKAEVVEVITKRP